MNRRSGTVLAAALLRSGDRAAVCACCVCWNKCGPCLREARAAVTVALCRSTPGCYLHRGVMKLGRMWRGELTGTSLCSSAAPPQSALGYSLLPFFYFNLASDTSVTTISNFFLAVNATCFVLSVRSLLQGGGFLGYVFSVSLLALCKLLNNPGIWKRPFWCQAGEVCEGEDALRSWMLVWLGCTSPRSRL